MKNGIIAASTEKAMAFVLQYETEEMESDDVISGFQLLIDTGLAWRLQGFYGRVASQLISQGSCTANRSAMQ